MMKRLVLMGTAVLMAAAAAAQSVVDSVFIDVSLADDGSALVTETWSIDVSDDITEWYRVVDNLGDMDVRSLWVRDETGQRYVTEDREWKVDRSRSQKAGRCGMVRKSDGYELCWGVGSSGPHIYVASYELLGLVKGHEDMDGFNYMFMARDQGSPPAYIQVRIYKDGLGFSEENAKIWAFGFDGEINFEDSVIVARTTRPFTKRSGLIALVGFQKGLFHPALQEDRTFEEVKEQAFEGSSYADARAGGKRSLGDWILDNILVLFGIIAGLFVFGAGRSAVKRKRKRKELFGGSEKDVNWYRDVPVKGDLHRANGILNVMTRSGDYKRLIAAYITRLFYRKAFDVVRDEKGRPVLRVLPIVVDPTEETSKDTNLEFDLYNFFKEAAGENGLLENKELKRWTKSHDESVYNWYKKLNPSLTLWNVRKDEVQQVFGLKKFLKDFTLIEDRGVVQVQLWNNYLIFASLFGIADQVRKDFKQVCPEYFSLSDVGQMMDKMDTSTFDTMVNIPAQSFYNTARSYISSSSDGGGSSWSGGGGSSSWGGGGGFSGGGSGGGGR